MYLLVSLFLCYTPTCLQEGHLKVVSTSDPDVFNIIYKADMKWNVMVTLYNEKGRKRMEQEIRDSDGFILPISMGNEKSGIYQVKIFTPVYDLQDEFEYVTASDRLASLLEVNFNKESRTITLSSAEPVDAPFDVYISNEDGTNLVFDDVLPTGGKLTRIYNLRGAPANRFQVVVVSSGAEVIRKFFE